MMLLGEIEGDLQHRLVCDGVDLFIYLFKNLYPKVILFIQKLMSKDSR